MVRIDVANFTFSTSSLSRPANSYNFFFNFSKSKTGKTQSNVLLKTQLDTVPLGECNDTLKFYNDFISDLAPFRNGISESQYCAHDPQGRNESCVGDSGGPLQIFKEGNIGVATIVGIVSFGVGCSSDVPGIYTRVAYYLNWIESYVWPKS